MEVVQQADFPSHLLQGLSGRKLTACGSIWAMVIVQIYPAYEKETNIETLVLFFTIFASTG